ncbi:4Fe-4S dicluster domain-containing protein [Hippea jasoniae]|uniref:4Fe-4S dicluster domain-containing protein n=1 Tax=Hippea jasoniae TaxID=944479 RepID=UPI0005586CD0|nr:4Fe-4S dicluster domain-containing protein [Hippea jasoniae]
MSEKNQKRQHRYAMVIVQDRCLGCMACYAACKEEWNVPINKEMFRTEVLEVEYDENETPKVVFLPILCNHCDNAPCVDVCPTGASFKREEDGIVLVDPSKCIGCKACMEACPYNARYYNEDIGSVDKCTFCLPRISNGLEPACVATCVGEARNFGDLNDENSKVYKLLKDAKKVWRFQEEKGTQPNVYYVSINY